MPASDLQDITFLGLTLPDLFGRVVYLAVAIAIVLAVQHLLIPVVRKALESSNVPSASIFTNLLKALLWFLGLLCVLQPVFGVDPTGFVAALGVTSVVISFGLQDTVSNVVAGFGLMLGKVVQPGDRVSVGDFEGVVTDVTWRHTVVRSRGGESQVIPNSVLNKTALTRVTRWDVTDCPVSFVVRLDADPNEVAADIATTGQRALGADADPDMAPDVYFLSTSAVGMQVTAHFHIRDRAASSASADKVVRALAGRPWLASVGRDSDGKLAASDAE